MPQAAGGAVRCFLRSHYIHRWVILYVLAATCEAPPAPPPLPEAPPSCVCAQSLSTVHFTRTSSGETTEHKVRFLGAGMLGPLVKVGFAITASSSSKPAVIAKAFYFLLVRNKMLLWQSQYLAELQFMVVLFIWKDFCIFDLTMQLLSQLDFLNPPQLVCWVFTSAQCFICRGTVGSKIWEKGKSKWISFSFSFSLSSCDPRRKKYIMGYAGNVL